MCEWAHLSRGFPSCWSAFRAYYPQDLPVTFQRFTHTRGVSTIGGTFSRRDMQAGHKENAARVYGVREHGAPFALDVRFLVGLSPVPPELHTFNSPPLAPTASNPCVVSPVHSMNATAFYSPRRLAQTLDVADMVYSRFVVRPPNQITYIRTSSPWKALPFPCSVPLSLPGHVTGLHRLFSFYAQMRRLSCPTFKPCTHASISSCDLPDFHVTRCSCRAIPLSNPGPPWRLLPCSVGSVCLA